ncbi:L,D-transpeptidase [Flavobacterium agrisoli]|uniref:L,D-transpeptidase n=1 Tax=Flavobacterium agrisoli TaxID=2793066 RepID=A0A934PKL6_9FLAO|nr:L,D-transpeptidase [Flavobacterium agrisoli]MBK0369069.1 L,D-transpeptidase [Flavobacterium agrisoli]
MKRITLLFLSLTVLMSVVCCKNNDTQKQTDSQNEIQEDTIKIVHRDKAKGIEYNLESSKKWLQENKTDSLKMQIVLAVNRTDKASVGKIDSIIVPNTFDNKVEDYLPFPLQIEAIKKISKIIIFSYPTQTFAAYKNGTMVYTGPTNMGRKKDPTPTGLFYTNWKAEETTSTFNDEWDLKWNFNIENKLGVGFHEYILPGYPASHSCLRLQEKDARYLYDWAEQWVLADKETVKAKGTPVLVYGSYDFDAPKPWAKLITKPDALEISENELAGLLEPHVNEILKEQKNSENIRLQL